MMGSDDNDHLDFGSPEWDEERNRRRGHPHGAHIEDPGQDMVKGAHFRSEDVSTIADTIIAKLTTPLPPPPSRKLEFDYKFNLPTIIAIVGMCIGGLQWINTQGGRIAKLEMDQEITATRAGKYVPIIEKLGENAQALEDHNKMEDVRIEAISTAIGDERRARQEDLIENRKAFSDIAQTFAKIAEKISEIGTDVAVIRNGRRSDSGSVQHDANLGPARH